MLGQSGSSLVPFAALLLLLLLQSVDKSYQVCEDESSGSTVKTCDSAMPPLSV